MDIKIKNSQVEGKVPSEGDLIVGEIAINVYQGTEGLYLKNTNGSIVKLAGTDIYRFLLENEGTISEALNRLNERVVNLEDIKEEYINLSNTGSVASYNFMTETPTDTQINNYLISVFGRDTILHGGMSVLNEYDNTILLNNGDNTYRKYHLVTYLQDINLDSITSSGLYSYSNSSTRGILIIDSQKQVKYEDGKIYFRDNVDSEWIEKIPTVLFSEINRQGDNLVLQKVMTDNGLESDIEIPIPRSTSLSLNISNLFTIPGNVSSFSAIKYGNLIKICGYKDNTVATITPSLGVGPEVTRYHTISNTTDGINFTPAAISLVAESVSINGSIIIPSDCRYFEVNYFIKTNGTLSSYYVDTDNISHQFSRANTPLGNFSSNNSDVTIKGIVTKKSTIKSITFGDDYSSESTIPVNFLVKYENLLEVNMKGLSNISQISSSFLLGSVSLESIKYLPTITSIGDSFLSGCSSYNDDLILPSSLISIGNDFMRNCLLFSKNMTLPQNITSIGYGFMMNCKNFIGVLSLGSLSELIFNNFEDTTLTVDWKYSPEYTNGVTISGTNSSNFKSRFQNRDTWPFRKLI